VAEAASGSSAGLASGTIWRVLFAEICTAVTRFTHPESSCAGYDSEKEGNANVPKIITWIFRLPFVDRGAVMVTTQATEVALGHYKTKHIDARPFAFSLHLVHSDISMIMTLHLSHICIHLSDLKR
jgi:hypothetical protein